MQVCGAPAGRPRLCLLLCQERPRQAGQESCVGPWGLEARQPWQLPSLHFLRSAGGGGVCVCVCDPGVQPSAGPRPSPSPDISAPLSRGSECSGSCCRTSSRDGKGWATVIQALGIWKLRLTCSHPRLCLPVCKSEASCQAPSTAKKLPHFWPEHGVDTLKGHFASNTPGISTSCF